MKRNILSSLLLLAMLATTAPMVAQQHRLKATPAVSGFVSVDPSVATNRTTAFGRHLVERLKAEGVKLPMPEERLLRMLSERGFGADCVSANEAVQASKCGFAPASIMLAGVGKTDKEIRTSLEVGIGCFNVESIPEMDAILKVLVERGRLRKARKMMTKYSVETAQAQFAAWTKLEETLLVKFIDGNIKAQDEQGNFLHTEYGAGFPDKLQYGGYNEIWKRAVANDPHAPVLESK